MRTKFVAGNWKMNLNVESARKLAIGLREELAAMKAGDAASLCEVAVCPTFVHLHAVAEALAGSDIGLGAQDVYFEGNGAYTGEISVEMLRDIGCRYVLVGHSERRHVLGEGDDLVNRKLLAAVRGGLAPILCIGELLEERQANQTETVIERHLRKGLAGVSPEEMADVTIAYEPVWAIGTGKTATADQAQQAHAFSRRIVADMFGDSTAEAVRIQYGGSVKPDNAATLMAQADVDGALVGGASLKVSDFAAIVRGGC